MSTPMEQAVEVLCQHLRDQELPARTAWSTEARPQLEAPVIAVSLRGCESTPAGFSGYLGQRLNPDTQAWEERYGKTVTLTFGLDLYAAPSTDPAALEQIWAALAQACLPPGPKGLTVGTFSCGETDYDQQARLLKRPAQLVCTALLVSGSTQEQGEFLDFEIRGERTL